MRKHLNLLFVILLAFVIIGSFGCNENSKTKTNVTETATPVVSPPPSEPNVKTKTAVNNDFSNEEWVKLFSETNYTYKLRYLIPNGTISTDNYYIYHVVSDDEIYETYYDGDDKLYCNKVNSTDLKGFFIDQLENYRFDKENNEFTLYNTYSINQFTINSCKIKLTDGKISNITIEVTLLLFGISSTNTLIYDFYDIGTTLPVVPDNLVEHDYLTVTEALAIASEAGDAGTSEVCYVEGRVSRITNGNFGEMYITDGENELYVYGLYQNDVVYSKLEDKPYSGDYVYIYGILKTYNDKPEMGKAELVKYEKNEEVVDVSEYSSATIKEAREAVEGTKVLISGVVGYITYASGMVPNGIFVIDETECIYVYDKELASRVKIGDEIDVAGTKTYYILDTEKASAEKWGYIGCCQLMDPVLVKQESLNKDFNKDWVQEITIKELMNTNVSSNITTSIFKVNAYIKRAQGSGFVNYYIDDLDRYTGSYCYSLCNGNDYEYLAQYDGKICTVYLSPFNCKSTSSSAFYRFVPILVIDEGFEFNDSDAPSYALDYVIKDQFYDKYTSDPEMEMIATVSDEFLGFSDVSINYSSSDESVLNFENSDDKVIMHVYKTGSVNVTITAQLGNFEATCVINIECEVDVEYDSITVKEAFEKEDGEIVQVRGVVSASLVNQKGFYLIDNTGMIAVRTTQDTLDLVKLGDEVIVTGTKTHYTKNAASRLGQLLIEDAELVVNLYGNHEFNMENVISDKTIDDIFTLSRTNDDITGNYYEVSVYIKKVATNYYTNYYLTNEVNGSTTLLLYAASGGQYSWLDDYVDQEITVIMSFTDWNTKSEFRGCVLAVVNGDNLIINDLNFR